MRYNSHMETKNDSRKILWENVARLMRERWGKENITRLSTEAKIGPATVWRIKDQSSSVGADVIDALATALKVESWMLLAPGGIAETATNRELTQLALLIASTFDDEMPQDRRIRLSAWREIDQIISKISGRYVPQETVESESLPKVSKRHA